MLDTQTIERHTLSVLVDDEPGVLARVVGLFSGRGYNIESLTVSVVDKKKKTSRISVVTTGTPQVINQIEQLLSKLIPVHKVEDLTNGPSHVERELALVKIVNKGDSRIEALRIADSFRARILDSSLNSFIFEVTGASEKLSAFIDLMESLGKVEVARTGICGITRGNKIDLAD